MISNIKRYVKNKIFRTIWNDKGVFKYFQQQVFFPKNSIIFHRAISEGIYEKDNVRVINALIKENTTVFDIGANIGLMALPMLSRFENVNVVSVEPSPNSFPFLTKTHQNSSFKNRWILINKAASNEKGKINFQLANPNNAAYESILNTSRVNFVDSVEVECTTIDNIWEELGKPEVSFIKIDIEGADLLGLRGAITCITNCRPKILMEWNKINISAFDLSNKDLIDFVESLNYKIFALPYFAKCETVSDLNLLFQFDENFLLVPNE